MADTIKNILEEAEALEQEWKQIDIDYNRRMREFKTKIRPFVKNAGDRLAGASGGDTEVEKIWANDARELFAYVKEENYYQLFFMMMPILEDIATMSGDYKSVALRMIGDKTTNKALRLVTNISKKSSDVDRSTFMDINKDTIILVDTFKEDLEKLADRDGWAWTTWITSISNGSPDWDDLTNEQQAQAPITETEYDTWIKVRDGLNSALSQVNKFVRSLKTS